MRIVVDAMGGDNAPGAQVQGTVLALRMRRDLEAIVVGNIEAIQRALKASDADVLRRLTPEPAEDCVPMKLADRDLMEYIVQDKRAGWRTSVARALSALESKDMDAMVSSGNTGATWIIGKRIVGKIDGLKEGALVATIPTIKRREFVAMGDVGLKTDRTPYEIAEAALLTGAYGKHAYDLRGPSRIGLLSNGSEPGKGNDGVVGADELLQSLELPSYVRNIEPQQIFDGNADAIGKDGFVGNTSLKWIEATAKLIKRIQEEEIMSDPFVIRFLNWMINRSKWRRIKKRLTVEENAAAPYVGLSKMVFKVHGSADAATFAAGILQAARLQERKIIEDITKEVVPLAERLQNKE